MNTMTDQFTDFCFFLKNEESVLRLTDSLPYRGIIKTFCFICHIFRFLKQYKNTVNFYCLVLLLNMHMISDFNTSVAPPPG